MSKSADQAPLENVLSEAKWLRNFAVYLARDRADADDMVQETWIAALRAGPEPRASLRPWLAQVLRNARRKVVREDSRRRRREVGASTLLAGEEIASTESMLARLELQRMVSELVRDLDEPYRTTLLLRFFEGREPSEIARALVIPAGTVRWRLNEALRRLRVRLDEAHGGNRDSWKAILLVPGGAAGGGTDAPVSSPWPKVAWLAGGALVPALVAGLLVARPRPLEQAPTPAPSLAQSQPQRPEETASANPRNNEMRTLFGVVLPALAAGTDAAAAPERRAATGEPPPPACIPADNAAGCIERLSRDQLPAPVQAALARATAGRKLDKLKIEPRLREGHSTFRVNFKVAGMDEEMNFAADGMLFEGEMDLAPGDLPPVIIGAVTAAVPDGLIDDVELHNEAAVSFYKLEDGIPRGPLRHRPASRFYEVKVHAADGTHKLKIAEDGKLLKDELK